MDATTDVLIVGAGPSGLICALALARAGVSSRLIERRPAPGEHPRAHIVNARTLEILTGLGVPLAALRAEAAPPDDAGRIVFCRTIREEYGRIDLGADGLLDDYRQRTPAPPYLNLSQVELERVLLAAARRSPRIALRRGVRWLGFAGGDPGASAIEHSDGRTGAIRHRFLVGADGARSAVRRALGVEMDGDDRIRRLASAYFTMDLSAHVPTRAALYWLLRADWPGTLIAHHVERRWVYHTPIAPDAPADTWSADAFREILSQILELDVPREAIRSVSIWEMNARVADRFRSGSAFLIGDAAHCFPPSGGLGLNTGAGDAHNLAWKLAAALRGAADESLLDSYERERRPVALANRDASEANYRRVDEVLVAFGLPPDSIARQERAEDLVRRLPARLGGALRVGVAWRARRCFDRFRSDAGVRAAVQRAIAAQRTHFSNPELELGYVYERGALVPGAAPDGGAVPGARLPHLWLGDGRSSLALIDPGGFALLTAAPSVWAPALEGLGAPVALAAIAPADAEALGLAPDGALLIRPDGHVAWRRPTAPADPPAALRAACRACSLRLIEAAPRAPKETA